MICALCSCKKSNLMTYEGGDQIFFSMSSSDSTVFTFKSIIEDKYEIGIDVVTAGEISEVDRVFEVEVDDRTTAKAGVDYELMKETLKMPAGKASTKIKIRLLRNAGLLNKQVRLLLKLLPNNNFKVEMKDAAEQGKTVSLDLSKTVFGDNYINSSRWSSSYMGVFSVKKMQLLVEIGEMDIVKFYTGKYTGPAYYPFSRAVQVYLNEQKAKGNIILDENKQEIIMGNLAQ